MRSYDLTFICLELNGYRVNADRKDHTIVRMRRNDLFMNVCEVGVEDRIAQARARCIGQNHLLVLLDTKIACDPKGIGAIFRGVTRRQLK